MAAEPPNGMGLLASDAAGRIVLKARADSWVEVRDPESNATLVARLLKTGDVYRMPDKPGLKLLTGNAGGLVVMVDGEVAPPLGSFGAALPSTPTPYARERKVPARGRPDRLLRPMGNVPGVRRPDMRSMPLTRNRAMLQNKIRPSGE
jgi:RodZ C-terminal domain